ncbi:MAG: hypothetical protein IJ762_10480 [Bacteroidaceae bacterium]|nr:hypothetical protein [Bacteroidaceae bacterium]
MKKFWKSLMFAALGVFALSSCEDVPAPYDIPGAGGGENTPVVEVEPAGDGTLESPYNVAAALELINAMEADVESEQAYYIKGKVASNSTTEATISQYGNMTFTMYDEGNPNNTFTAFQVYGPGNKKFTSVDQIKAGDEVVVYGKVVNYRGNTPETVGKGQAYVYSINSNSEEPGTPEGIEVTCAEAAELTNALADGATSEETYTITGYITEVVGNVSSNQQTFWMADTKDGGKVFEAYYANLPEGVSEFKVGMKVKITGTLMKYVKDGKVTPESKNANVEILENGEGGGETPVGTEVTCAQAVELTNALADGATSEETYTITGYITEVVGNVSSNQQSFWMADTKDGGKVFEAYYANLPEGVSAFKAGMKVKITGNLMKYVKDGKVTPEIKNATVEILENGEGGGETPVGTEVSCAQAVELTNNLADGATSEETYTITGYITEVVGNVSRNQQSFWMADTKDGGKVFEAYYANLPEGVSAFAAGMKVKITGNLMKYVKDGNVTPEIKNANVEILENGEGGGGGGTSGVEGNSITFSAMNYENAQDFDGQSIAVGDATLAWSKGSGSTTPKYYTTGTAMRLYGGNTLTISSSKTISKIEFTYASGQDSNNRPFYATSSNTTIEPGTYDYNTQVWSGSAQSIVLTYTGNGGHVRLQAISITYAE